MAKKLPTQQTATVNPLSLTRTLPHELSEAISTSLASYQKGISGNRKLRLIDYFLTFLVFLGILQFAFCLLVGTFPFNAFLGGFCSTVAQFVLTISLRLQTTGTKEIFQNISSQRAFAEYIFASLLLHFIVYHFIN
ncbi:BA75_02240T0 [Komagataella pastoris]|uniref:Dolichyl-diphosphooligosaccharide--protein glycosyltransferase subunit OST2 n=1 Tax=Komagataella pastoris TaxID=4922 RepID=A0A1B2JAZ8_PICPA|nr:BA75_02240T0 [Komagataella pastoris]